MWGDTLAVLDAREVKLQAAIAGIEKRKADVTLGRTRQMHQRGLVSDHELETAQYDALTAQYRLEAVQMHLDQMTNKAPSSGLVSRVDVQSGDLVTSGMTIMQIIDPVNLQAYLFVAENQIQALWVGMTLEAVAISNRTFRGKITRISPVIDPDSGTCRVTAVFPGAGRCVRPGTQAEVRITVGEKENRDDE